VDRYTHMGVYGLVTWEQKVLLIRDSLGAQWFTLEETGALSLTPFAECMIKNFDRNLF
jgi:hypothetical protein